VQEGDAAIVTRKNALISEQKVSHMGGKGAVTVTPMLTPEQFYGKGRSFSRVAIPPGSSIGAHRHRGDFEAYYILSGTGEFHDNGQVAAVFSGDLCYTPEGFSHGITNTGKETLELISLIVFAP